MKTRTRVLLAVVIGSVLSIVTGSLLLSGNVGMAIWMEGPYFPLTMVLPGSVDTLETMLVAVAFYYFIAALLALRCRSRRVLVVVLLVVLVVDTLGVYAWHRFVHPDANAEGCAVACVARPDSPAR
jgi:sterol desaturase/sphingolipid hydroxylase (fatty acid hydroxylase superfamily)